MKKIILLIIIPMITFLGCESDEFQEYKPKYYVEAILLVDQPLTNIKIFRTVPTNTKYVHNEAIIKDAKIRIFNSEVDYLLDFIESEKSYYALSDTSVKVQPETTYKLEITLSDGNTITSSTTTPARFDWINAPKETIQFPTDTINQPRAPAELDLSWTEEPNTDFYILTVKNLDTLDYGKYFSPPSDEKNRRVYSLFRNFDELYNEVTTVNFIANTTTPIVWLAFKWFGAHEIQVYAPDFNYLKWFLQSASFDGTTYHNILLDSVEGIEAIGVFGSASVIKQETFLLKNQP